MKKKLELDNRTILVTGSAGYIGYNLVLRLIRTLKNALIIGIDNLNDYYDPEIKIYRLDQIKRISSKSDSSFVFIEGDISNQECIKNVFKKYNPTIVVNLAAQAGVRYSITNPDSYINSNIIGFYNIIECCKNADVDVEHFVYASSSSVYGGNKKIPFSIEDKVDTPVSLYAATKKSNELIAHAYSKLYNIPSTGLRFFTVIGGETSRPDMALQKFTDKLIAGDTIKIYNYGNCKRDFTNVNDVIDGVVLVMAGAPVKNNGDDGLPIPPCAVYNIGHGQPDDLLTFVTIIQEELVNAELLPADYNFTEHQEFVPMQQGDVPVTYADTSALERDYGYHPKTDVKTSVKQFVDWYKSYYSKHKNKPFDK